MKLTKNFLRNLIRESLVKDSFVPSSEEDYSKFFIIDEDGGTYVLNVDKWDSLRAKLIALHKENPKNLFAYLRDFAESPSFGSFHFESKDLINIANRMDFNSLLAMFDKEAKDVKAGKQADTAQNKPVPAGMKYGSYTGAGIRENKIKIKVK